MHTWQTAPTPGAPADDFESIAWPEELSIQSLGEAIGRARGMRVVINPIPEEMQSAEVNGLTVSIGKTAKVYYDPRLSPLNCTQTILHEFAHILHGDVCAEKNLTKYRATFDSSQEQRAELTAMRLMFEFHRRTRSSEVLDFLSGSSSRSGSSGRSGTSSHSSRSRRSRRPRRS